MPGYFAVVSFNTTCVNTAGVVPGWSPGIEFTCQERPNCEISYRFDLENYTDVNVSVGPPNLCATVINVVIMFVGLVGTLALVMAIISFYHSRGRQHSAGTDHSNDPIAEVA
jgi:hypothetical protein